VGRSARPALRFQTTAKASADAHALTQVGLARFDLVIDGVAFILAMVLLTTGNVLLGVAVIVVAGLSLVGSRFHPLQRALIAIRFRSILGQVTEVTIDEAGLRFENLLGSSFVPWSSITAVRSNSDTVAFVCDRVVLGYIPSIAFESPDAQAKVVVLAHPELRPPLDPIGA
jgi:hypothetical protein